MLGSQIVRPGLLPVAAIAALACAGCARSQPQLSADTFLSEHSAAAAIAAASARAAAAEASRLRASPTAGELAALTRDASEGRRRMRLASEWSVTEGGEEEDVPRAEGELVEGSDELEKAMSSLLSYARSPSPATLATYRGELARGREKWNEGIGELWYLGRRSSAPTV